MDDSDIEKTYELFCNYEDVIDFAKVVTEDDVAGKELRYEKRNNNGTLA